MEVVENEFKETEIGLIPEDWEVVKLGEVGNYINGYAFKPSDWSNTGKPIIRIQNLNNPSASFNYFNGELDYKYLVKKGDILISWSASLGAYLWNGEDAWLNQHIFKVELTNQNVAKDFLYFALLYYFVGQALANLHGSTMKHIVKSKFLNILISLPPLEEQKAIADILSTVQNAIEKTEKVINATKQLKKSMMKHLFTYGAVAVDEIDKVRLKESEIGLIPEDWEVVRLGEVFKITQKPKNLKLENYNLIPFIPMENIGFGTFNPKYVMKNPKDISSGTYFEKGDLLLAKITPSFENGKQSIVDDIPTEFGMATTEVIPIKQKEKSLISYLFHYLLKPEFRKYLASKMEGSTGRKRLPKEVLFNTLIPLPPLDEQQKIANILTTIDQKIQAEEKKKQALQNLFKILLQQLMTGKIRVKKAKT